MLLLAADLFLPLPGTLIMSALGYVYGPVGGGLLATVGSFLGGTLGYGLCRLLGRGAARRLLGEKDLEKGERLFASVGGWIVVLSRWLPLVPEVVSCMAGLTRMPARSFLLALLCGFGGGNFASSMANINFFFPKERKGSALGVNAGLGNLGVSAVQFLAPLVVALGVYGPLAGGPQTVVNAAGQSAQIWAQNAAFVWVPFIVICAVAAWIGMNDIADAKASFREQAVIFRRKHNWLMCWLYLGTFGSFIGYAAGFPLLIKSQFPGVNPLQYAWLGPLVGAVVRPFGGWLADKLGGARVTFWNFIVMALAVGGVLWFLKLQSFAGFFACFMVLFLTTGIGNGSTFRMIPVIFPLKEASPVLGFTSAFAAYGGFFIPKSYGTSISMTGGPEMALYVFIVFYLTCIAVTWWYYSRKDAEMPC